MQNAGIGAVQSLTFNALSLVSGWFLAFLQGSDILLGRLWVSFGEGATVRVPSRQFYLVASHSMSVSLVF